VSYGQRPYHFVQPTTNQTVKQATITSKNRTVIILLSLKIIV
jgi:hypothetical protein